MRRLILALTFAAIAAPAVAASLPETFNAVCTSRAVKSEKLTAACAVNLAPDALKDGSRFKNVGIGAELNTLASNLRFILPACEAEDSSNCHWNAATRGNGQGESFTDVNGTRVAD